MDKFPQCRLAFEEKMPWLPLEISPLRLRADLRNRYGSLHMLHFQSGEDGDPRRALRFE